MSVSGMKAGEVGDEETDLEEWVNWTKEVKVKVILVRRGRSSRLLTLLSNSRYC